MPRPKQYCECDGGTRPKSECWIHNTARNIAQKKHDSKPERKIYHKLQYNVKKLRELEAAVPSPEIIKKVEEIRQKVERYEGEMRFFKAEAQNNGINGQVAPFIHVQDFAQAPQDQN